MEKKQNVPALRFQGFSGEWESHYLGMLGVTFSGLSGKTKADFGHGQARFVPYLNVFNHPIADLQETEAIEIDDKQTEVKYGDIFFTVSSETPEEVGMSSVWLGNEKNVYLNSFCFGYRPTSTLYPFFMAFLLRSSSVRKEFVFLAQGISRYNISKNKAMGIGISFPLFREQCKIGDFFQNLDKFIDGQSHKVQKLQQFRQAMLMKLFPREGAAEPELRFRGFSGPWNQGTLGNVTKRVIVGLATSVTPYYRKKGIPIFRNLNIKENHLDDKDILFLDKEYADCQKSKQIHTGDVLTVHTGYIGTSCVVPSKYDGCLTFTTLITTPNPTILDGKYLSQYLNTSSGMEAMQAVTTQGGRNNLNVNDFVKVVIKYPNLDEQIKIAEYLTQLDTYISLQQKKLERMQRLKAALLEKLFV